MLEWSLGLVLRCVLPEPTPHCRSSHECGVTTNEAKRPHCQVALPSASGRWVWSVGGYSWRMTGHSEVMYLFIVGLRELEIDS